MLASPLFGSWMAFLIFGGEFPGTDFIPRLFTVHVLLVPGIMLALVAAHVGLVALQKHTQYPGPGRTNKNVVGFPLLPASAPPSAKVNEIVRFTLIPMSLAAS